MKGMLSRYTHEMWRHQRLLCTPRGLWCLEFSMRRQRTAAYGCRHSSCALQRVWDLRKCHLHLRHILSFIRQGQRLWTSWWGPRICKKFPFPQEAKFSQEAKMFQTEEMVIDGASCGKDDNTDLKSNSSWILGIYLALF